METQISSNTQEPVSGHILEDSSNTSRLQMCSTMMESLLSNIILKIGSSFLKLGTDVWPDGNLN